MLGKLSLAAIPLNQPIVMGAMGFIALVVVTVLASAMVLWGAIDVFSVMLAIDVLHVGSEGTGFLVSAISLGLAGPR